MSRCHAWQLVLLVLHLVVALAGGQSSMNQSFPMPTQVLSMACSCDVGGSGQGFSGHFDMCMKGTSTSCDICTHQKQCARVSTVVGDGIRAFLGDCRITPRNSSSQCYAGQDASLAFPTSIAADVEDNLYIADFGNNRVRRWDKTTDTITTIAGSGEIGFSGDGGPARFARLRQPEGIAVKPGVPADRLEVYFSDFKNQRIRRLTLRNGAWYIDTVAGTGVKGDAGPGCDAGCNATAEAMLYNPRALAFSSVQDLFIADSGNRKVRKLTPEGVFSTLVGVSSRAPVASDIPAPASIMLPGHYQQPSMNISIGTLYFLNIDHDDNLWFIDGPPTRFWKTPLYPKTEIALSGSSGRMLEFYLHSFYRTPPERLSKQASAAEGLQVWGPLLLNESRGEEHYHVQTVGNSEWVYGAGKTGNWCQERNRELCPPAVAQDISLGGVNGFCFDAANNIYISDTEASEIVHLDKQPGNMIATRTTVQRVRLTTRNCRCFKYWFDPNTVGAVHPAILSDPMAASLCRENQEAVAAFLADLPPNMAASLEIPPCETDNYCAPDAGGLERCFIDRSTTGPCSAEQGFCSRPGLKVNFQALPLTAVLSGEDRIVRKLPLNQENLTYFASLLSEDLWVSASAAGPLVPASMRPFADTTQVLGFVAKDPLPEQCSEPCCELPLLSGVQSSSGSSAGRDCQLRDKQDLEILDTFFANHTTVTLLVGVLDAMVMTPGADEDDGPDEGQRAVEREDCEERCMLDDSCKSYMVPFNVTSGQPAESGLCIFFRKNFPYHIYTFSRTDVSSDVASHRSSYRGPLSPYARLFNMNSNIGLYATADGHHMPDLLPNGGPVWSYALNLVECQDLCTRTVDCFAIAYPGCYLLNNSNISSQSQDILVAPDRMAVKTIVYVKKYLDQKVEGVVGSPQVYTFNGDDTIRDTYLNKPSACVVDSKGDVSFADVWNQRIRKITGYSLDCVFALDSGRHAYISATEESRRNCTSSPGMTELYARMQREVVEQRSLATVKAELCNYVPVVDPGYLETNNTMVLCTLCSSLWAAGNPQRPEICPSEELCYCASSIMEVIKTDVFKLCPLQNAYHDRWHLWISSFLHCLTEEPSSAVYLQNVTERGRLESQLQSWSRRRR
mmetsp:Transcript_23336/g.66456  ORF Transcript_23336/g.66456 Transcript_23336/m.66456 type:complete len:1128 (-) Transcript_23336:161-3544(-)